MAAESGRMPHPAHVILASLTQHLLRYFGRGGYRKRYFLLIHSESAEVSAISFVMARVSIRRPTM